MSTRLSIYCNKVIEAGWLAAVIAVPLFFNIHTARTFEPDKLTLMRSIALIMLVAWVIKALEEGAIFDNQAPFETRLKAWLKRPFVLPTALLIIVYTISTIFALSPLVALWGSYQRLQGTYTFFSYILIFALMAATMREQAQVDRLINTIIIASVPVSLYGIIQANGLDPLPWAGDVTRRVASNMGNAIFVASYLIMIVPITISRLIKSMMAIVTEENASWGHTILSAIYIFVIVIQILTILYSGSRGPQIGLLAGFGLIGLLLLLVLRQNAPIRRTISIADLGSGLALVFGLGLGVGLGGGGGYLGGLGTDALLGSLKLQAENLPLWGAALGGFIGFTGVYTYLAAANRGRHWLWLSWPILAIGAIIFFTLLNISDGPLTPLRNVPYLGRLGHLTNIEGGTGRVRVLIWEGALELLRPHEPLGVEGEYQDNFNRIRPAIGYGPESMFNAFAFAYPNELAHVEARGSSADRSHNETIDSLVITGLFGFIAFYFLMGSVFYYTLRWLGWIPTRAVGYGVISLMVILGIIGTISPYLFLSNFNLWAVFLPAGLYISLFLFLCWRGFVAQPDPTEAKPPDNILLMIGVLGALMGHFLEVHFVFSIAATYTYFWVYLGLLFALYKIQEATPEVVAAPIEDTPTEDPPSTNRRRRRNRRSARRPIPARGSTRRGGWETWLASQGLVMAFILIILVFDFVPIQFDFSTGRYSLLWMTTITLLVGLGLALSDVAVKQTQWRRPINWGWGTTLYLLAAFICAGLYIVLHALQRETVLRLANTTNERIQALNHLTEAFARQQGLREAIQTSVESANGVFHLLVGFYAGLFILLLVMAFILTQGETRRISIGWQTSNWWLYPPLILATVLFITFKNINVVKADTLLKEGQKYRDARLWDLSIAIHQASVDADPDEDFYYLMLALNYQLKAQDNRVPPADREVAWKQGEQIALTARDLNRFNPDNTGNMGRYYFTIAQIFDKAYYDQALAFFQKAIELAPQNVDYYNLVGQAHYIQGQYDDAIAWYGRSAELDDRYYPTWLYKGDTHVAKQEIDEAVEAHAKAIALNAPGFVSDNYDARLNFYRSINRIDDLVAELENYLEHGNRVRIGNNHAKILWGIGHAYRFVGDQQNASQYIQNAVANGYANASVYAELGDVYLALAQQTEVAEAQLRLYSQAEQAYQQALQENPNLPHVYSSLGFIYARTGRPVEAIQANTKVLERRPNDYDSNKNLAILYQASGQYEQALTHAEVALEAAPEANKDELRAFIAQVRNQMP